MDRFLLKQKSANEAEVEEVHVEENQAAPTTKRNNVRVLSIVKPQFNFVIAKKRKINV